SCRVLLPGNMDGDASGGIGCRRNEIGKIPTIPHTSAAQRGEAARRVADSKNTEVKLAKGHCGLQQEFADFVGTLSITPVADPDHVGLFLHVMVGPKNSGI